MRRRDRYAISAILPLLILTGGSARGQCVLPYQLTNGQMADATQVMANYNSLISCLNSAAPAGSSNSVQYNAGGGSFGGVAPLADGQVIIGVTNGAPQARTLTAGSGIAISNGAGSITVSTVAGAGSGLYGPVMTGKPTAASTGLVNWLNQGSSVSTDSAVGLSLDVPAGTTVSGLYKTSPSPPYAITVLLAATRNSTGYNGVGIGWYNGSNKFHVVSYVLQNGGAPFFEVEKWNSFNSFSGNDFASASNAFSQPTWLRIADDGVNVSFSFSQDGANFLQLFSTTKSSGFLGANGYSNVLLFANPIGSRTIGTIMSWTQG